MCVPLGSRNRLSENLGDDAGADGATAFADSEAEAFFDSHRLNQLDGHGDVVAGLVVGRAAAVAVAISP